MTYDEYKRDLTDQIGNKRAKKMVMLEIDNHIEELTQQYENEGMEHSQALEKSVLEMGNPIETGMELNKIHRPQFPFLLFGITILLSGFGILLQSKIFPVLNNEQMVQGGMIKSIMYGVIGILVAFGCIFLDYSIIVKHVYKVWSGFILVMLFSPIISQQIFAINGRILISIPIALFPIIFAALLYRQRLKGVKGVLICIGIILLTSFLAIFSGYYYTSGFLLETVLICFIMIIVAIQKGIMGRQKKRLLAIVIIPVLITIGTIIMGIFPLADYQQARLDVLLHPSRYLDNMSYNYTPVMVKRLTQQFSVTGSRTFASQVESLPSMEMHTNYAVTSMFTWFGMAIGIIILLFLFVFCIYSLIMSLKQNNRISFLFGTMCSVTLLVRCIIYVLNNWGLFIPYSTYFPFLQYGLGNALVSGCYIGIIMCVYRNSNILGEPIAIEKTFKRKIS